MERYPGERCVEATADNLIILPATEERKKRASGRKREKGIIGIEKTGTDGDGEYQTEAPTRGSISLQSSSKVPSIVPSPFTLRNLPCRA